MINWTSENRSGFTEKNQIFGHKLHENELFSDDGLIALIDRYPFDKLEVFTMGYDPKGWGEWRLGRRGTLDGRALLEAVKLGRIWLNLRKCNHYDSEIDKLCQALFAEMDGQTGVKTMKHDFGLLISSPKAHVFYHLDMPLVMLCQLRGVKTVYLYPPHAPCVNDIELESIALREHDEQLKLDPSWDEMAFVHDLKPGEMLSWIQNAPHRIVNHDCVNVSASIEFMTPASIWRANLLYANGCLRRYFGLKPSLLRSNKWLEPLKIVYARLVKLMGGFKGHKKLPQPSFTLNASQLGRLKFDEGISPFKPEASDKVA